MLAADVEEAAAAEPEGVVRLLPAFDHYVVAAPRDADAVLAPAECAVGSTGRRAGSRRCCWSTGGSPACGRTSGAGRPSPSRSSRSSPSSRAVRAGAEAEAEALAAFLGGELELAWA